jgi:RNA polymerase sigma-70 factor (ECF subfamily)
LAAGGVPFFMSTVPDLATLDELLEHAGWTRALAVRLLGDADDADDVVQETWLSALRVPPNRRHALRPWLATVVRNLARSHGRRRLRSRSREQQAAEHARLHSVPSSEELLSQLQTERTLATLVLDLPEPYRHTVILRYHHGKSAADIARAEDIPEGTVRWRLKYGLDQLRQNFEERAGGRDVARGILIPFATAASAVTLGKAALAAPVVALSLSASSKAMVAATVALVAVSGTAVGTAVVKHHRATVRKASLTTQLSPGTPRGAVRKPGAAASNNGVPAGPTTSNTVLAAAPFTVVPPPAPAGRPSPLLDIEIQATSPGHAARSVRWRMRGPATLLINVRPASETAAVEEEPVPSRWCCRRALVVGDYVEGRACLRVPFDDTGEQCQPYGLEREVYCTNDTYGQYASGDLRRTGRLVCAGQAL